MNNDLISRQDAIDALEEQLWYLQTLDKNDNPTAEATWYGVNWARNTIADLPSAQKKSEWIPVSERLPEALQTVLVTSKGGYVYTSCIVHGEWEYGGEVIAWQPLPEPYKEGGAE